MRCPAQETTENMSVLRECSSRHSQEATPYFPMNALPLRSPWENLFRRKREQYCLSIPHEDGDKVFIGTTSNGVARVHCGAGVRTSNGIVPMLPLRATLSALRNNGRPLPFHQSCAPRSSLLSRGWAMFMQALQHLRRSAPKEPQRLFPSSLNPCTNPEHRRRGIKALYGVHGRVTELCVLCVQQRANTGGIEGALQTFNPNPNGTRIQK